MRRSLVFRKLKRFPFVRRISKKVIVADEADLLRWRAMQTS
jgi:hypothetical protein